MADKKAQAADDAALHKRPRLTYGLFSLYDDDHNPSSFRLEHHYKEEKNEHRLVVFVAQRRGAIAKIIFSSTACDTFTIHVLECKPQYRKCGLGSLLVMAALQRIQLLLQKSTCSSVVQLDAEEDERRFGRLVQFYTSFGFQLKPGAKISFLNNNCSEVYRKVPMRLDVGAIGGSSTSGGSRITQKFSPLRIQSGEGDPAEISMSSKNENEAKPVAATDWILHWLDDEPRCAVFRTTRGSNLAIVKDDTDGSMSCYLSPTEDEHPFMIQQDNSASSVTIQSVATGEFLTLDPSSRLQCRHNVDSSCHWKLQNDKDQPHRLALTFCSTSPLRNLCFFTAEAARRAGLPDWLQLVALVYHKYVGMDATDGAAFMETLASSLPHEGLAVLQHDWNGTEAPLLQDEVADCVAVVRQQPTSPVTAREDCERLWNSHYAHVCAKYGLSSLNALEW